MAPASRRGAPPTSDGPGGGSTRRRPTLSKSAVLEAAVDFVDRYGLAELSMRKLGAALDVEGMALYRYVRSRDELLDAMVDRVMDQLYADPSVLLADGDDWREFLRKIAEGIRRVAHEHPALFPLLATRAPTAPWIRPPLRSLRWVEGFLSGLLSRGFDEDAAVYAYRAFGSFLVGHLLVDVAAAENVSPGVQVASPRDPEGGAGLDGADPAAAAGPPGEPVAAYPVIGRLADRLAVEDLGEEFEDALEALLERLDAARARLAPSVPSA
jgi:AcrR family transcriptional regulator